MTPDLTLNLELTTAEAGQVVQALNMAAKVSDDALSAGMVLGPIAQRIVAAANAAQKAAEKAAEAEAEPAPKSKG